MKTRIIRIAAAGLAVLALTIGTSSVASAQPTSPQASDTSWT
ncbi:hypothetical protein [Nocardioides jiangxiensis]|uniref:Uncharacterized protein n=1 Tax=Nocardioides jiangxiensis TaxID=3064524 RepID=A0ABT9B4V5_9ACTN|nr:hypothetical protein [Nocardioides sp. WY-20]MDO7868336.1 hypothetical protein [Nocardioides sp. WY-20]